ncbi:MAG: LlaJI family restriction endonuclease [Salinivirgaceae bacterium]|nr:LlaJI family restriction endonuclease [Salinivirgaceae bacterium]
MRILIEEHAYEATDDILEVVSELGPTVSVEGKVCVGYVGYYYNRTVKDCVFILPKVLLDEEGRAFGKHNPEQIVHLENPNNPLEAEERKFIYELSVWIYRAISVFKERHENSKIVLHERVAQIGHGMRRLSNTFLDILLSLEQFYKDNQDFFFFVIKNQHSGYNKINWTKTITHSQAFVQNGSPIYLNPVNKRRQVNFDEELMVIYFSILNYIHNEYGFPFDTECHYELIGEHQFKSYLNGMGKARLQEIKYKYFSDKALELWELCYAFFDEARQITINTRQKEYLLVKSFEIVFEDIIDELLGGRNDELPKELQEQPDGKQVDHLYRYKSLTETNNEKIYYIGDSKYYKRNTSIGKEALYKQFTYARNVIQWNLDLFLDESKTKEQNEERAKGTNILRDDITEGYNIIPNFFISAKQQDLKMHSEIEWIDKDKKDFASRQFENRLFDRDTLLVCHYDVNFLYVVALYGRKNEGMKSVWREKVREQFRKEIQSMLQEKYNFYAMTPRESVDDKQFLKENFHQLLGKVFTPYRIEGSQPYYSLALDKEFLKENESVLNLVATGFYYKKCELGKDPRTVLPKVEQYGRLNTRNLVYIGYVKAENPDIEQFRTNQAKIYYSGNIDFKDVDIQTLTYLLPIVAGKVQGVYKIESIKFRKLSSIRPLKQDETDNLRIVFELGNFEPFVELPIQCQNRLHNNDVCTIDDAKSKILELLNG